MQKDAFLSKDKLKLVTKQIITKHFCAIVFKEISKGFQVLIKKKFCDQSFSIFSISNFQKCFCLLKG